MDIKDIHIGDLIRDVWNQKGLSRARVCNYFQCDEEELNRMLDQKTIQADELLRWSKLLEYDFFRIYSQHLILFAPRVSVVSQRKRKDIKNEVSLSGTVPVFRKSVYTKEIVDYLLEMIHNQEKTPNEIVEEYKIPKTTLYRWIQKYRIKTK